MYDFTPNYGLNAQSLQFTGLNPQTSGLGLQAPNFGGNPTSTVPGATSGFQLGLNAPTIQMGISGLSALGNLWGAFQASKLAREQLDFTKQVTNTNLNNSIQSYNTTLEDRARARGVAEGRSDAEVQNYVNNNRLTR